MLRKVAVIVLLIFFSGNTFCQAQDTSVTKSGYFAAITEQDLEKAVEYFTQKDNVALDKLMSTGRVFMLKGGIKVYVTGGSLFSGKIKIRPAGSTAEIWTFQEAVSTN